jgi:polyribonucleotide nucleotidyltransferase
MSLDKHARADAFAQILTDFKEKYNAAHTDLTEDELAEKDALMERYYGDVMRTAMRRCVLDEGKRLDGRVPTEIRPIWCEVSPLPGPHGSAIFTRGETQSLSTCTLGTKLDEKLVDDVLDQSKQRFLLHYNFPRSLPVKPKPNAVSVVVKLATAIWPGAPLKGQIPENYPLTVRIVSDILESTVSSSMATVCAGTLALMDAGVAD